MLICISLSDEFPDVMIKWNISLFDFAVATRTATTAKREETSGRLLLAHCFDCLNRISYKDSIFEKFEESEQKILKFFCEQTYKL